MKLKWFAGLFSLLIILLVMIYLILNPEKTELNATLRKKLGGTYLSLSNGVTHYRIDGPENGQVVVLVHGGTVPSWCWDEQIRALSGAGFKVLSYDKYGRGYSDRPDIVYDQKLYQKQLFELVNKLGFTQPFNLIGVSLGGGTAVNFTANYPDRIRKLILISPLIRNYKISSLFRIPVFGEFMARVIGIRVITDRFKSLYEGYPAEPDKYLKLFIEQTTYKGFQRSLLSMIRNDALGDYSSAYQAVGKQKRKILLIWGTADSEITEVMINEIRDFIPDTKLIALEGVGHGILTKQPDKINSFIINFLHKDN